MLALETRERGGAIHSKGGLQKRSMRIAGHRTSVALEPEFWEAIETIARKESKTLPVLFALIDQERMEKTPDASLASAIRVYALEYR
jgi:predicted DNA-binding ribbon-helix-helix protein